MTRPHSSGSSRRAAKRPLKASSSTVPFYTYITCFSFSLLYFFFISLKFNQSDIPLTQELGFCLPFYILAFGGEDKRGKFPTSFFVCFKNRDFCEKVLYIELVSPEVSSYGRLAKVEHYRRLLPLRKKGQKKVPRKLKPHRNPRSLFRSTYFLFSFR